MSRPNQCPIPPISIPKTDSNHVKIIPLIKYYNASQSSFQNQPQIFSPKAQRLSSSSGRSPRVSVIPRKIDPFQHIDTDFIFDIVKFEKFDDVSLNSLILKLEDRLFQLVPDAKEKIKKEKENSLRRTKEFSLQIEPTLLFESCDYEFDQKEDDEREKLIKMLEEKLLHIAQTIFSRNNQQE